MTTNFQSDPAIIQIVQQLLTAGHPERIILFGSRAKGNARPDSDYDVLIVENSSLPRHRRAAPYRRALKSLGYPKDILVWTPREIDEWKNIPYSFITTALREGQVLFER